MPKEQPMTQPPEHDGPPPEQREASPAEATPTAADERERIRAYLEQHRPTYSAEGLRRQLIEAGYHAELVDATIAEVFRPALPEPAQSNRGCLVVLITAGTVIFNFALLIAAVAAAISGLYDSSSGTAILALIAGVVVVAVALEVIGYIVLRRRGQWTARPLGWGIATSLVSLLALALLFGLCIAAINSSL
jgi:hypothetical protein